MIPISPYIVGIDEVGRGAWAGPMVAAAVLFPLKPRVPRNIHLRDSKLLTKNARSRAYEYICNNAFYTLVDASSRVIDEYGVHQAHKILIKKCISSFEEHYKSLYKGFKEQMTPLEELIYYIDGNPIVDLDVRHAYLPHGDMLHKVIASASIVAKVTRDAYMKSLSVFYPHYGFDRHVGYGTSFHQAALKTYGPSDHHRMSYNIF